MSLGGGVISIISIDGFSASFSASSHTLIVKAKDKVGSISFISSVLAQDDCNIATMNVSRRGKHDLACHSIEMDSGIRSITLQYLQSLSWIEDVIYIPNVE